MSTSVDVPTRLASLPPNLADSPSSKSYFNKIVTAVTFTYLLRVPLLIAFFIFAFLPVAALHSLRTLLQNLFILSVEATFWTTVMAFALCWSLLLTSRLVLLNGYRFRLPQVLKILNVHTMGPKPLIIFALFAVPLLATQFIDRHTFGLTDRNSIVGRLIAIVAGALFAYVLAFIAFFLSVWIAPQKLLPPSEKFPAPELLQQALLWAEKHGLQTKTLEPFGGFLKRHFPKSLWVGYLDPANGVPWGGHWLAFLFAGATAVLTFALDVYRRTYLGESSPVPAFCYVMILLLNLNWILAFLSFFLDRYRVPLLVPILVLCFIGARLPSSDHYYRSQTGVSMDRIRLVRGPLRFYRACKRCPSLGNRMSLMRQRNRQEPREQPTNSQTL